MTAPLRVYVAGSSRDLERAERVIVELRAIPGVEVPVDWPANMRRHGPDSGLSVEDRVRFAEEDAAGAYFADAFVLLRPTEDTPSVGAWVELGISIGAAFARLRSGNRAPFGIVAGRGTECIFDALVSSKSIVDTDDEAIEIVRFIAGERAA
jgi:hypothetical protein